MERVAVFGGGEVSLLPAPVADGLRHALNQLANAGLALRRAQRAVKIFAGNNVDGGHRPVLGRLHVALLKDRVALGVSDAGGAQLPFHFVIRRNAGAGEIARELQSRRGALVPLSGWCADVRVSSFITAFVFVSAISFSPIRSLSVCDVSLLPRHGFARAHSLFCLILRIPRGLSSITYAVGHAIDRPLGYGFQFFGPIERFRSRRSGRRHAQRPFADLSDLCSKICDATSRCALSQFLSAAAAARRSAMLGAMA